MQMDYIMGVSISTKFFNQARQTYSSYGHCASLLQVWDCGTIFQLIWDKLTSTLNSSSSCWRHFCSHVESTAHCG